MAGLMLDAEHLNTKSVLAEAHQCLKGYEAAALYREANALALQIGQLKEHQLRRRFEDALAPLAPLCAFVQPMLSAELRNPPHSQDSGVKTMHTERTTGTRWDSKRTLRIYRGRRRDGIRRGQEPGIPKIHVVDCKSLEEREGALEVSSLGDFPDHHAIAITPEKSSPSLELTKLRGAALDFDYTSHPARIVGPTLTSLSYCESTLLSLSYCESTFLSPSPIVRPQSRLLFPLSYCQSLFPPSLIVRPQ